jgi:iron-sulfur cluster assembly protein/iron-sulfur cluster insertion protein
MITFSEKAARKVGEIEAQQGDPKRKLRVFVETGGCSGFQYGMAFAEPLADDVGLESSGVRFFMDPVSLEYMKGSVIDFDDGLTGKGFEIRNPNAQQTCGCGKSFN